jgi:hypothetical protein
LEVRVLPAPPRSRHQTEISRFFVKSPELAEIRARVLSLQAVDWISGVVLGPLSLPCKIAFPHGRGRCWWRLGSNAESVRPGTTKPRTVGDSCAHFVSASCRLEKSSWRQLGIKNRIKNEGLHCLRVRQRARWYGGLRTRWRCRCGLACGGGALRGRRWDFLKDFLVGGP